MNARDSVIRIDPGWVSRSKPQQRPPGSSAQHLERIFFDYADRMASQALAVQITDPTVGWTSELVTAWSRFIVGIHLRHPDSMPELRAGAAAQWDVDGDKYQAEYEKIRKPSDPATFDEYIAIRDPLVKTKMQLNLIIKGLDNEFICSHINQMQWTVADFSHAGLELLVSDRPVEIHALAVPKGIVTIPLTPTKLFIAVNDPASLPMIQERSAREVIERINLSLVSRAPPLCVGARQFTTRVYRGQHVRQHGPKPVLPPFAILDQDECSAVFPTLPKERVRQ